MKNLYAGLSISKPVMTTYKDNRKNTQQMTTQILLHYQTSIVNLLHVAQQQEALKTRVPLSLCLAYEFSLEFHFAFSWLHMHTHIYTYI